LRAQDDLTLCSSSLSSRSRPEKLGVVAELGRLNSTSSPSASASSQRKEEEEAEGTVSVPVDPDPDGCVLALRDVAVVAVDASVPERGDEAATPTATATALGSLQPQPSAKPTPPKRFLAATPWLIPSVAALAHSQW
jgi:hypothetical protein